MIYLLNDDFEVTVNMSPPLCTFASLTADGILVCIDNTIAGFNLHITSSTAGAALGQPALSLFRGRSRSFRLYLYTVPCTLNTSDAGLNHDTQGNTEKCISSVFGHFGLLNTVSSILCPGEN
jgi:hypothetical protein